MNDSLRESDSLSPGWRHGAFWGHGAYLGPDYSAEHLHRLAETVRNAGAQPGMLEQNRYDASTETLVFSPGKVAAYRSECAEWSSYFGGDVVFLIFGALPITWVTIRSFVPFGARDAVSPDGGIQPRR